DRAPCLVRLLEMPRSELLGLALRLRGGVQLQPGRETLVQLAAQRLGKRLVGRVADEHVPKAVAARTRERRLVRSHEILAFEGGERPHCFIASELFERVGREEPPCYCGRGERGTLVFRQQLEARRQEGLNRRWNRSGSALVDHHRDDLLEKERVP